MDTLEFVISGDVVMLHTDYVTTGIIDGVRRNLIIKRGALLVAFDNYVPQVYIGQVDCYLKNDPHFATGQVVDPSLLFTVPLDLCYLWETNYEHLKKDPSLENDI